MGEGGRKEEEKGKGGEGKQRERGIERKKERGLSPCPLLYFGDSGIYILNYVHACILY